MKNFVGEYWTGDSIEGFTYVNVDSTARDAGFLVTDVQDVLRNVGQEEGRRVHGFVSMLKGGRWKKLRDVVQNKSFQHLRRVDRRGKWRYEGGLLETLIASGYMGIMRACLQILGI